MKAFVSMLLAIIMIISFCSCAQKVIGPESDVCRNCKDSTKSVVYRSDYEICIVTTVTVTENIVSSPCKIYHRNAIFPMERITQKNPFCLADKRDFFIGPPDRIF